MTVAALLCAGAGARAAEITTVGLLFPDTREARAPLVAAFEARLRTLGWRIGDTLRLDARYANADPAQLERDARALAGSDVGIIVGASTAGAEAAQRAANGKPVPFVAVGDPVRAAFTRTCARPTAA